MKFLNKNENSRKIFGQRERKIIEKQLSGVSLTQSEKNRLSRDIRKKFQFIKDISKFEGEFDLKKGSENKKIIHDALEIILEHRLRNKIKGVLLFGSLIKNKMTFRSDIDIAVEFDKITKKDALDFRKRITGETHDKIDIQVFNFLPEKIKRSILKSHRILYKNERKD